MWAATGPFWMITTNESCRKPLPEHTHTQEVKASWAASSTTNRKQEVTKPTRKSVVLKILTATWTDCPTGGNLCMEATLILRKAIMRIAIPTRTKTDLPCWKTIWNGCH